MAIVAQDLLRSHIFWPKCDWQKEMCDYYHQRYGFPGVIGAIDGTHVTISKPPGVQFSEDYFSVRKKNVHNVVAGVANFLMKKSGPFSCFSGSAKVM